MWRRSRSRSRWPSPRAAPRRRKATPPAPTAFPAPQGGSAAPVAPAAPGAPTADRVPPALGPGSVATDPVSIPVDVGQADPSDTTLARACAGLPPLAARRPVCSRSSSTPARPTATRAAAAKAVGGTLAGSSPYGEDYVRLEVGAGPLTAVADRLIRQNPVKQVSPAPCPAPPAMPSAGGSAPGGDSIPAPAAGQPPAADSSP